MLVHFLVSLLKENGVNEHDIATVLRPLIEYPELNSRTWAWRKKGQMERASLLMSTIAGMQALVQPWAPEDPQVAAPAAAIHPHSSARPGRHGRASARSGSSARRLRLAARAAPNGSHGAQVAGSLGRSARPAERSRDWPQRPGQEKHPMETVGVVLSLNESGPHATDPRLPMDRLARADRPQEAALDP